MYVALVDIHHRELKSLRQAVKARIRTFVIILAPPRPFKSGVSDQCSIFAYAVLIHAGVHQGFLYRKLACARDFLTVSSGESRSPAARCVLERWLRSVAPIRDEKPKSVSRVSRIAS